MKLLTELVTATASTPMAAIWLVDGLAGSAFTALESVSTEDLIALVWLGKSDLAELTSAVAWIWIVASWVFRLVMSLVEVGTERPLIELSRVLRSEQYAGLLLLLPQPVAAPIIRAMTSVTGTSVQTRPA